MFLLTMYDAAIRTVRRYAAIIGKQDHPVRFLVSRLLMKTGLCTRFIIPQRGFVLRFYPSMFAAQLWVDPACRNKDLMFIQDCLRPGDVMVDVGANVGNTALAASVTVGPGGRVFAYEPHPRTCRFLRGNVALNHAHNVETHNLALGAEEGTVTFSDVTSDDRNRVTASAEGMQVPIQRLDRALNCERISLLKIDVEGYEKFVMEGAERLMANTACIYFEASGELFKQYGYTTNDVLSFLRERGFRIIRCVPGRRHLVRLSDDCAMGRLENLIAVRSPEQLAQRMGYQLS